MSTDTHVGAHVLMHVHCRQWRHTIYTYIYTYMGERTLMRTLTRVRMDSRYSYSAMGRLPPVCGKLRQLCEAVECSALFPSATATAAPIAPAPAPTAPDALQVF